MTSHIIECLPSVAFNYLLYKYLLFSYLAFDFDRVCGRLYELIRACLSDYIAFNAAVPFKLHRHLQT